MATSQTTPVPADQMPVYALNWMDAIVRQALDEDVAVTDVTADHVGEDLIVVGCRVHGVAISVTYNITQ